MRNEVAAAFAVELPATAAFDYPTASTLAAFVCEQSQPLESSHSDQDEAPISWDDVSDDSSVSSGAGRGDDCCGHGVYSNVPDGNSSEGEAAGEEARSGMLATVGREDVLAGVRAAVEAAVGAAVPDKEPLMEVGSGLHCAKVVGICGVDWLSFDCLSSPRPLGLKV